MTCQLDGHPMSFADLSVSIPSVVNPCRFQQGTCEIGVRVSRTQALPLTSDILMSLVVVSLLKGETRLALAFLFGFACLLRTGEIASMTRRQLTFLGGWHADSHRIARFKRSETSRATRKCNAKATTYSAVHRKSN